MKDELTRLESGLIAEVQKNKSFSFRVQDPNLVVQIELSLSE
jgi:hypothetical protein